MQREIDYAVLTLGTSPVHLPEYQYKLAMEYYHDLTLVGDNPVLAQAFGSVTLNPSTHVEISIIKSMSS